MESLIPITISIALMIRIVQKLSLFRSTNENRLKSCRATRILNGNVRVHRLVKLPEVKIVNARDPRRSAVFRIKREVPFDCMGEKVAQEMLATAAASRRTCEAIGLRPPHTTIVKV